MEEVCVWPGSSLPLLLAQVSEGEPLELQALEAAGVHAAAARVMAKVAAAPTKAKNKSKPRKAGAAAAAAAPAAAALTSDAPGASTKPYMDPSNLKIR